jgi:hypothetical protein
MITPFIKESIQKDTKNLWIQKTAIFAYLRKSTTKEEQKESLIQQQDWISSIVNKLWFEKENIRYFAETYSWFENKRRKEWKKMIEEVDKLKEPCLILTRDISRLSRNPTDTQVMMDRLYGDNKCKRLIDKIFYLEYDSIKFISKDSDKEEIHKRFSSWYYDSLDTKKKSIGGIILKLENGQFPYRAPKWLDNYVINWRRILRQNDKMRFIKRAFEMKVEWKTLNEISKYLQLHWDIKISKTDITSRLFVNTVYIGEYTEKNTNTYYNNLEFFEKIQPISKELWNSVQTTLGRKISQYWAKQEGDILWEKLRTKDGKRMSKYTVKGHHQYKNTIEHIHISEKAILKEYVDRIVTLIDKTMFNYFLIAKDNALIEWMDIKIPKDECIQNWKQCAKLLWMNLEDLKLFQKDHPYYKWMNANEMKLSSQNLEESYFYEFWRTHILLNQFLDKNWFTKDAWFTFNEMLQDAALTTIEYLVRQDNSREILDYKDALNKEIIKLETRKNELEAEKMDYIKLLQKKRITDEEYDKIAEENKKSIDILLDKIQEFKKWSEKEEFINRLPEILTKTFELSRNVGQKRNTEDVYEDLLKLLQITTFELTVDKEKELKIKLFDVLDKINFYEKYRMEAPSGVEPDYKALQASA